MFQNNFFFSKEYNDHLRYRDYIRSLVIKAREELKGSTLYGEKIDTNNPEDLIAVLYILSKDFATFHEGV